MWRVSDEAADSRAMMLRRTLLTSAGLATLALAADRVTTRSAVQVVAEPVPSAAASPSPKTMPALLVTPLQSRPVFTLKDFRKVVPGPAFPAHAVALTIDDGPHPEWTPKILSLLAKYHVHATFFLIGNQVRGHEPVARMIVSAGHQIANHTWSHPLSLPRLTTSQMRTELQRAQDKIYSTTSVAPTLFRSPGGAWSRGLFAQTAASGLIPIEWAADPRDWSRPGTAAITRTLLAARPGQILLCHDGGGDRSQTLAALKTVIPALLSRGYVFVPLA